MDVSIKSGIFRICHAALPEPMLLFLNLESMEMIRTENRVGSMRLFLAALRFAILSKARY